MTVFWIFPTKLIRCGMENCPNFALKREIKSKRELNIFLGLFNFGLFHNFWFFKENVQGWHRGVKLRGYCFLKIIFYNVSKFKKFQRHFSKFLQCEIPRFETIFWPIVQMFVYLLFSRLCNISLPGSGYYTQLHNWPKTKKSTNFGSILSKMVSKSIKIAFFQLKND